MTAGELPPGMLPPAEALADLELAASAPTLTGYMAMRRWNAHQTACLARGLCPCHCGPLSECEQAGVWQRNTRDSS